MAYSFTEPHSDDDDDNDETNHQVSPPVMVPMADVLNHVAKNNAHLNFGKDRLTMVAKVHISKVTFMMAFVTCLNMSDENSV